ncbi:MAG: hypothetical protein HUU20_13260 [Pirellulales bacterium]|nr:hypothetical protein [Pirellulales bacterium]
MPNSPPAPDDRVGLADRPDPENVLLPNVDPCIADPELNRLALLVDCVRLCASHLDATAAMAIRAAAPTAKAIRMAVPHGWDEFSQKVIDSIRFT